WLVTFNCLDAQWTERIHMRFLTAVLLVMSAKAGTITSASVSLGCPNQPDPSGSMSGTDSATFDASCELNGPHASGEASAQASVGQLSSSASVGGTELFGGTTATADAQYTDTITV